MKRELGKRGKYRADEDKRYTDNNTIKKALFNRNSQHLTDKDFQTIFAINKEQEKEDQYVKNNIKVYEDYNVK